MEHSKSCLLLLLSFLFVASCQAAFLSQLNNTISVNCSAIFPGETTPRPCTSGVLGAKTPLIATYRFIPTANPQILAKLPEYKKVDLKLCWAPASTKDRGWRKVYDDLSLDRNCLHSIATDVPYVAAGNNHTLEIPFAVPTGVYYIRAYIKNDADEEVAFGQSTNKNKTTNLFKISAVSGRSPGLNVAIAVFSTFSGAVLLGYFVYEKKFMAKV